MDWLTRLPWIGPYLARLMRTHAWRAFAHLEDVHWTRLAAAMTFTSFLALFPLLAVVAAVGAATLSENQLDRLEERIADQIPGVADELDIAGLVAHAGAIGLIGAVALLVTGVSWVSSLRDCLRAVWRKDDEDGNPVVGKLRDGGVLLGLGAAVLISLGASAFATAAVNWTVDRVGLSHNGSSRALLTVTGVAVAVVADFLIFLYLLTLLPGVRPPRRAVLMAALIGAVGIELLKVLLSGYLSSVAGRNVYGAFGTPVALLLWFNFVAKLLLYCAAWTATQHGRFSAAGPDRPASDGSGGGGAHRHRDGRPGARPDRSPDQGPDGAPGGTGPAPSTHGSHRWRPPATEADGDAAR